MRSTNNSFSDCILELRQAICPLGGHRDPKIAPPRDGVPARRSRGGCRPLAIAAGCVGRDSLHSNLMRVCTALQMERLKKKDNEKTTSSRDPYTSATSYIDAGAHADAHARMRGYCTTSYMYM